MPCVAAAGTAAGADDVIGAEPKIHVHTPLTQPQNPPLEDEVEALGVGVVAPPTAPAAPAVELAEADGEALGA